MSNEHIKEYCKNFIKSKENPHYALFIKGDWGTGKTFFINNLLKELFDESQKNKKNPYYALLIKRDWGRGKICFANEFLQELNEDANIQESDIIKISLFGVKTCDDIDLKIFQSIHPQLSSKGMKITGTALRCLLKWGTKIDLGDFNEPIFKKGTSSLLEKKLLVVDDFERALMTPREIFGYFSELITESDIRVIFVGNEEKIVKNDEKNREYFQIKEKTIGMEFQISPLFDEAIDTFLDEIHLDTDSDRNELKTIIKEVSSNSKCKNLRTIRQALYNLHLLIGVFCSFEEKDKQNAITVFLLLFIQKSMGKFENQEKEENNDVEDTKNKKDDVKEKMIEAISKYLKINYRLLEYWETHPDDFTRFFHYYNNRRDYIPLLHYWYPIIFEGMCQTDILIKDYEKEQQEIASKHLKTSPLYELLDNFSNMDRETFHKTLGKANEEFNSCKYRYPGEVLHYTNIMMMFADCGLIRESVNDVKNRVLKFLADFREQIIPILDWDMLKTGYLGYAYGFECVEFSAVRDEAEKINKEGVLRQTRINLKEDLNLLKIDVTAFCRDIVEFVPNEYYRKPLLSFFNIDDFYQELNAIPADDQSLVLRSFERRYGIAYANKSLDEAFCADYENLKILATRYTEDNEDCLYNPQAYIKKGIAKRWMDLVKYFEEKYPELKNSNA